ncbi:MAG: SpoIIE family protein phosphatase [Solirubrobacteraceae bacterium]|nr:SpoIIE family protein phosphatase [Solirubrobacteraceae bacterium]
MLHITDSPRPSSNRKKRSDAALNKARLVEAARTVLAEQPQASMATIAAEAGLGRNTIHRHFPTRQDLIDAVRLQATDDSVANDQDYLRKPGELSGLAPTPLSVSDVLNKVPPFQLGTQIVAEAQRLDGVSSAAIYLVDLDGAQLRRLAGAHTFPPILPIDLAVGPEIPREAVAALRATIEQHLPNATVAPMYLRGRAIGVMLAIGTEEAELRALAQESAAALSLAERYTDQAARVRRSRATSPAAEIQQNMLPPRIVRVGGAMLAGNVMPGYEIGGDWFDYTDNPEGAWLGIADTEGNGARAAATAAVVLGAFRAARHLERATPASCVHLMKETLAELGTSQVSMSTTIATWSGAQGLLQWVTCGDYPPLLVDAHGELRPLGELQPALGAADFPRRLRIQSWRVEREQRILFVSDGVVERENEAGERFGLAGIQRAITGTVRDSAASMVRAIEDAARSHSSRESDDDATLIALVPSSSPQAH